jgi:hypothetical protein
MKHLIIALAIIAVLNIADSFKLKASNKPEYYNTFTIGRYMVYQRENHLKKFKVYCDGYFSSWNRQVITGINEIKPLINN